MQVWATAHARTQSCLRTGNGGPRVHPARRRTANAVDLYICAKHQRTCEAFCIDSQLPALVAHPALPKVVLVVKTNRAGVARIGCLPILAAVVTAPSEPVYLGWCTARAVGVGTGGCFCVCSCFQLLAHLLVVATFPVLTLAALVAVRRLLAGRTPEELTCTAFPARIAQIAALRHRVYRLVHVNSSICRACCVTG